MSENYHRAVGKDRVSRRLTLNQILNPTTQQFLLHSGLKEGMRVLDLGCGIGAMSSWIAQAVGEKGSVVGLDNSEAQLTIAKEIAQEQKVNNIEFIQHSVEKLEDLDGTFDFIYCRFLFIFLADPTPVLNNIYNLLNPNGVFACESAILGNEFCYPESPAFNKWRDLNQDIFTHLGKDPKTGKKLFSLMSDMGFNNLTARLYQPVLLTQEQKNEMLVNDLLEQATAFINAKLATDTEIAQLETDLRELAEDESSFIAYNQSCQIAGQK